MARNYPNPVIHLRDHDGDRIRIWTDNMAAYGQFNVVSLKDVRAFKQLSDKMTLLSFVHHRCQTNADCDCSAYDYGEEIK